METQSEPLLFYQNVSTSKELRDASNAAEVSLREYGIEISMRLDVYQSKVNAEKNIKASGRKLNPEETRLVEKLLLDGKRAGLNLPEKERKELEKLQKELSQTCVEFSVSFPPDPLCSYSRSDKQKNFNEENVCIQRATVFSTRLMSVSQLGACNLHSRGTQRHPYGCCLRLYQTGRRRQNPLRCYLQNSRYLPLGMFPSTLVGVNG
jgi:hypothetical protein